MFLFFLLWAPPPPPCDKKRDDNNTREKREEREFFFFSGRRRGVKFSRNFPKIFFVFSCKQKKKKKKKKNFEREKKSRTKKVPFLVQRLNNKHTSENKNVPTRSSSSTVVDAIIGSTPREAFQQQTTTPASAGVDFDDAKKTPRRLGLVFGVGYYRSGERHGERFEIDRGAQFPPIIYILRRPFGRENYKRFVFRLFAFFDDRSRETRGRPPSSSILPKDHPTPTHPRARALSSEGEKRGRRRRRRRRKQPGLEEGIRFDLRVFFFFRRRGSWGRLSSNRIRLFFPTERKCLVSISFLFFSFEEGGGGGGRFFIFFILVFFTCSR